MSALPILCYHNVAFAPPEARFKLLYVSPDKFERQLWTLRRLGLRGNRFDVEPEITGRILRLGYRIYEVPIDYAARTREQGKKLTWRDGVQALWILLRERAAVRST